MAMKLRTPGPRSGKSGQPAEGPSVAALATLAMCMLVPSLAVSIANVALPTLQRAFAVPFASAQWIVLAYLLAVTASIVSAGRLGDIVGRRRSMLGGICLFAASSLVCAVAPSVSWLIAARGAQGVGAAVMMALSTALVADLFPKGSIGRTMGLLGTMSAIGTALGPSLGGVLITWLGWRSIFLFIGMLGIIACVLAYRSLAPAVTPARRSGAAFDIRGTVLLAVTLAAYALGVTAGPGSFGVLNLGLLLASLGAGGILVIVEGRAVAPLVPLSMLRDRALGAALAANALVSTLMMATLVVGPFYLAASLGLGPGAAGLWLSIGPAVAALCGAPAGRMVDRFGAGRMVVSGLSAMAVATTILTLTPSDAGVPGYVGPVALLTLGYAIFQAANNTLVMRIPLPDQRGVVSGLLSLSRNLGLITGASVMAAVFARVSAYAGAAGSPAQAAATGMHATYGIGMLLSLAAIGASLGKRSAVLQPVAAGRSCP